MPKFSFIAFLFVISQLSAQETKINIFLDYDTLSINSYKFINFPERFKHGLSKLAGIDELEKALGFKHSRLVNTRGYKLFLFDAQGIAISTTPKGSLVGIDVYFNIGLRDDKELPKGNFLGKLTVFRIKVDESFTHESINLLLPYLRVPFEQYKVDNKAPDLAAYFEFKGGFDCDISFRINGGGVVFSIITPHLGIAE